MCLIISVQNFTSMAWMSGERATCLVKMGYILTLQAKQVKGSVIDLFNFPIYQPFI